MRYLETLTQCLLFTDTPFHYSRSTRVERSRRSHPRIMDLESMFIPSSNASETKETTVTVHQADVALRMGQSRVFIHPKSYSETSKCVGFIRKVYGILTAQLLLSMVMCVVMRFVPSVSQFVQLKYVT